MFYFSDDKNTTGGIRLCPHCMSEAPASVCPSCHRETDIENTAQQLRVGTVLRSKGREYLLGRALGQGGFGVTYIALDLATRQKCAIKECFPTQVCFRSAGGRVEPYPDRAAIFAGAVHSFQRESEMLSAIRGLHFVVQHRDAFTQNGTAYMVMEYLDGINLTDKVKRDGPMDVGSVTRIYLELLHEMEQLHQTGLLHRDIAPDNIMLMADGTVKLLDFGCARSMEDGKSMTVELKHGFAPVEQYMTRGQGPWTDLYALSATMYYCITGRVPPMSPERLEKDTLKSLSALGISTPYESAILWGLTIQPKERPNSVRALLDFIAQEVPAPPPPPPIKDDPHPFSIGFSGQENAGSGRRPFHLDGFAGKVLFLVIKCLGALVGAFIVTEIMSHIF